MNDSMDGYLSYLKTRIAKLERKDFTAALAAKSEFNRALDYARRHKQTVKFAESQKAR